MVIGFKEKWGPKIRFVYSMSFRVQLRSQLKKFPRRHFDAEAEKNFTMLQTQLFGKVRYGNATRQPYLD